MRRRRLEEIWLRTIRIYTYHTPVSKGKYRLYQLAKKVCREPHESVLVRARDGRRIWANLSTGMHDAVFFFGDYEPVLTKFVRLLVNEGDVCVDAGANFGWYTTLMAVSCGKSGSVHSFEPVPDSFYELKRNLELLGNTENVFLNECALGDRSGFVDINVFDDLPTGHASMSLKGGDQPHMGNTPVGVRCQIVQLDSYLKEMNIDNVGFVKVDIEGAEMMFLKGAERLFHQIAPPIFLMEMALGATRNFGYLPDDLVKYIGSKADYEFYEADENKGTLHRITGIDPDYRGANVFCLPTGSGRIKAISGFIE